MQRWSAPAPGRIAASLVFAMCCGAASARGDGPGDGVYGRFDGELALSVGAGGGASIAAGQARGTFVGELRLRYVDAAGPFISGRWGPDAGELVVVGAELRPLFPMLFLENMSTGYEWVDLAVQSLGFELGAALLPLDEDVGVGLAVGFGLELPLALPSQWGHGVWLRLGARYVHASAGHQAGPGANVDVWTTYATLCFKALFGDGISTWEPPRYRLP